ncbi:MAG: hypothetical protein FGM62_00980 [Methylobacterium sp.]|nr:hypothetical protein [Methylobacterium sp.]
MRGAALVLALLLLAGCDKLTGAAEQKIADAEAIGFACRVSSKTPEECMKENEAQSPSSILDGWKSADEDIKAGKLDPGMKNTAAPGAEADAAAGEAAPADAESKPAAEGESKKDEAGKDATKPGQGKKDATKPGQAKKGEPVEPGKAEAAPAAVKEEDKPKS